MDEFSRPLTRSLSQMSILSDTSQAKQLQVHLTDVMQHPQIDQESIQLDEYSNITAELVAMLDSDQTLQKLPTKAKTILITALDKIENRHNQLVTSLAKKLTNNEQQPSNLNSALEPILQRLQDLDKQIRDLQANPSTSYANAVRQKTPPKATAIILNKGDLPTKQLSKIITSKPPPENINVLKYKVRQTHIEARTANEEQHQILKQALTEQLKEANINAVVTDKHPATTKIIFHNASIHTEQDIVSNLEARGFKKEDIKKAFELKSKNEGIQHWVFELPRGKTNELLLSNYSPNAPSHILIGYKKLYYRIFVRLTRCRNCHMLGQHATHLCPNPKCCVHCGGDHEDNHCNNDKHCINCDYYNREIVQKSNNKYPIHSPYHSADDSSCPTYKAGLSNLMRNEKLTFIDANAITQTTSSRVAIPDATTLRPQTVPRLPTPQ